MDAFAHLPVLTDAVRQGRASVSLVPCGPPSPVPWHGMYPRIIDGHALGLVSLPCKPLSTPRNSGQARHGFN